MLSITFENIVSANTQDFTWKNLIFLHHITQPGVSFNLQNMNEKHRSHWWKFKCYCLSYYFNYHKLAYNHRRWFCMNIIVNTHLFGYYTCDPYLCPEAMINSHCVYLCKQCLSGHSEHLCCALCLWWEWPICDTVMVLQNKRHKFSHWLEVFPQQLISSVEENLKDTYVS